VRPDGEKLNYFTNKLFEISEMFSIRDSYPEKITNNILKKYSFNFNMHNQKGIKQRGIKKLMIGFFGSYYEQVTKVTQIENRKLAYT
jgi:hypothetical protein